MAEMTETSYDLVPYHSYPYWRSHPDNLSAIAQLFGVRPADPNRARVLELGCGAGGNLLPMAVEMPDAQFLGVDLSRIQLQDGMDAVAELGLTNIELRHLSIDDFPRDEGPFDYIVCHGVYSWVVPGVQHAILDICSKCLAPEGIAYVSYNTHPGWRIRGMVRDMMKYHSRRLKEPLKQTAQARALLDFLINAAGGKESLYGQVLASELRVLESQSDNYVYHDHLEENNVPLYFHEFMDRAHAADLQYLGEAQFSQMLPTNLTDETRETLQRLAPDILQMEQYMDFVRNRSFRRTLLCRKELTLDRRVAPERTLELCAASPLQPSDPAASFVDFSRVIFTDGAGGELGTGNPVLKSALAALREVWPQAVPIRDLPALAYRNLGPIHIVDASTAQNDLREIAGMLMQCYLNDMIDLKPRANAFARQPSDRPTACPLARRQAIKKADVTNRRHQKINLGELEVRLLSLLDGALDVAGVVDRLAEMVAAGDLYLAHEGKAITAFEPARNLLREIVPERLETLARHAVLTG